MAETIFDVIAAFCLIGGALMSLAAAIGLLRFPDLMSRMHAATKPQVLGLWLFLAAMAAELRSGTMLPILLACWIFQLLTTPVSAHMVGRAGYRTKYLRKELLSIDELDEVVEHAATKQDPDETTDEATDETTTGASPEGDTRTD